MIGSVCRRVCDARNHAPIWKLSHVRSNVLARRVWVDRRDRLHQPECHRHHRLCLDCHDLVIMHSARRSPWHWSLVVEMGNPRSAPFEQDARFCRRLIHFAAQSRSVLDALTGTWEVVQCARRASPHAFPLYEPARNLGRYSAAGVKALSYCIQLRLDFDLWLVHFVASVNAPATTRVPPKATRQVMVSPRNSQASRITKARLSLSTGATWEAVPSCNAR